jgi:hypothetical protein
MKLEREGEVAAARCPCLSFVITRYSQPSSTRTQLSKGSFEDVIGRVSEQYLLDRISTIA